MFRNSLKICGLFYFLDLQSYTVQRYPNLSGFSAGKVATTQVLKRILARLPDRWQTELRRLHYGREIQQGIFVSPEPEYEILSTLISPGDSVIDVGANVGQYTKRFSELVGAHGRVIAFEPVPETFFLLAANARRFPHANVSLINAAASDKLDTAGMNVPMFPTGLANHYEARLCRDSEGSVSVLTVPLDSLWLDRRVTLVKIDVEDHELPVLKGMQSLIRQHHPTLIVETRNESVINYLTSLGYLCGRLRSSPNVVCRAA